MLTKQSARRCPARHHYQLHHPAHHHHYQGQEGKQCKAMADEDRDAFGEFSKVQPEYTKGKDKEKAELFSFLKKSDEQTHQLMMHN